MCILIVSMFVYVDIGSHSPPMYQMRVVTIGPAAVPVGNPHRRRRELDELVPPLEWLAPGVSNDRWQHLRNDVIASIHSFPPEWTTMMRRMAMACDYIHRAARGDLPVEDEYSEEC